MPTMNTSKTTFRTVRPTRLARLTAVAMLLGGTTVAALAQYKIVGPDGKVTYTDKPPAAADIRPSKGSPAPGGNAGMPYETRQAMGKYPVTLYSTHSCPQCDSARQALRQRGVPFNEYTVNTDSDYAAYKSRTGMNTFPAVMVGSNTVKGWSPVDLGGYLDAAGYPAQAHLTGYNWPPASPLTTPSAATAAADDDKPAAAASAPAAPLLPPPSKNGIQF